MERGSFFYSADGRLLARPSDGAIREASADQWREAGLAMNPALDDPFIVRFVPGYVDRLLLAPEDR
jgi:hypothetical protein